MDVISDRSKFLEDLETFMTQLGKPIGKSPVMGYKELDLHQLFREVVGRGGFNEVVKRVGSWAQIWKKLDNFDPSVTDASYRLKKNYERCLLEYEQKRFPVHKQDSSISLSSLQDSIKVTGISKSRMRTPPIRRNRSSGTGSPSSARHQPSPAQETSSNCVGGARTPFSIGDITIECFGVIVPRTAYVDRKYIYPVGFQSSRMFFSTRSPGQLIKYTSLIIDGGDHPKFVVTCADDPTPATPHDSATDAWSPVLRNIFQDKPVPDEAISGSALFGLTHPVIEHLLRQLPLAKEAVLENELRAAKRKPVSDVDSDYDSSTSPSSSKSRKFRSKIGETEPPRRRELVSSASCSRVSLIYASEEDKEGALKRSKDDLDLEEAVNTLSFLKFQGSGEFPLSQFSVTQ
eukprot:TRINITY_DN4429_c0_g1_i2.p2 TRINITY_DN4429_c0_g1~~TRINITY_DN4429_c0_g1_i2.p2  ORF type:complete len:403 (+),score=82.53 TRINITY_DN4429_c0_g1_i2:1402-2610(+)